MRFVLFLVWLLLLQPLVTVADGPPDIFSVLEEEMLAARAKQAVLGLSELLTEKVRLYVSMCVCVCVSVYLYLHISVSLSNPPLHTH